MSLCPSILQSIENFFAKSAINTISIPILQPADPFLDMAGEALRRRIFMTENENGDSLCLRPEFTIPVCLKHIENAATTPKLYAYIGEVFRQHRSGSNGFYQAGIEDLGDKNEAEADARSLAFATTLINHIDKDLEQEIILGDQAIFAAILNQLDLAKPVQKKLLRSFGNNAQLLQIMQDLSNNTTNPAFSKNYLSLIEIKNETALLEKLEKEMLHAGISPSSGRTPREIAKRLLEKKSLALKPLSKKTIEILNEFLNIKVSLQDAEDKLLKYSKKYALNMEPFLKPFSARNKTFLKTGIDISQITYDAAFGRPLDYYTGLVYEIRHLGNVLAGGGRYNHLMTMLGAKKPISAVGFSIWLDRLQENIAPKIQNIHKGDVL